MTLQHRLARPLPDMWDWEPVQWSPWTDDLLEGSSFYFHAPLEAQACDKCGVLGRQRISYGKRAARHDLGETYPTRNLYAARCADCGHDTVADQRTGEHWDLDDTDYGPAGSVRPEHAHTTDLSEPTTLF